MTQNKTLETDNSVSEFIESTVENQQKKDDSFALIKHMETWSGFPAKMWGTSIIGFGSYHYKYASGREGDAPLLGFSPRKAAISLYTYSPVKEHEHFLDDLGKFKMGKSCLYVKKLSDINLATLEAMSKATIEYLNEHHECACKQ